MLCQKCGNQLGSEDVFCSQCGSRVADNVRETCFENGPQSTESFEAAFDTAPPSQETTAEEHQPLLLQSNPKAEPSHPSAASTEADKNEAVASFISAADATKHRNRFRMPGVVVIALIGIAISGTAFAAHFVYSDIVAPLAQPQEEIGNQPVNEAETSTPSEETLKQQVEKTPEPQAEKAHEPEILGNPQHVLQIAEILAMPSGANILNFVESQGFVERTGNAESPGNPPLTAWMCPIDDLRPFSALTDAGISTQAQAYPFDGISGYQPGTTIYLGANATPPHEMEYRDINEYTSSASSLKQGETPTSIHIANLPLPLFDANEAADFINEARLGTTLAAVSISPAEHAANAYMNNATEMHTGIVFIRGEKYFWYFAQRPISQVEGLSDHVNSFIGCCTEQSAFRAVDESDLYDPNDWDARTDEEKAAMLAYAIAQGHYIAFDGYRNNAVTGEYELMCPESKNSETYIWANRNEYAALYGEESATQRFDNYIIGYER